MRRNKIRRWLEIKRIIHFVFDIFVISFDSRKCINILTDLKTAIAMIEAGADRIGASKSVEIMKEYEGQNSK